MTKKLFLQKFGFAIATIFLLSTFLKSQEISKQEKFQNLFDYVHEHDMFNGSVAIVEYGNVIFHQSYGYADFKTEQNIDADTPFYLASLSKAFTAFGIVLLNEDGKLSYDDKVSKHLPNFPYQDMTVTQLLTHTSGLPEYQSFFNQQREQLAERFEKTGKVVTNADVARLFSMKKPPLEFEPGSNFNYSNTGYVYLALLIQKISGQSFAEFMDEHIFEPLKMTNTFVYTSDNTDEKQRALAYKYDYKTDSNVLNDLPDFFKVVGGGGIYSSTNDLLKWDEALRTNKLAHQNVIKDIFNPPTIGNNTAPYGFGWFVRTLPFNGNKAVTHSGAFVGFRNSMFRELENNNATIILSNNSHEINSELNSAVVRILYGAPFQLPKLKGSNFLLKNIYSKGIEEAKSLYLQFREDDEYDFSESQLNRLGYDLLEDEMTAEAIEVFTWNVEAHPESSNVYDSLGEAYLKLENKEKALKNYRIAFQKDPDNTNAKRIIDTISNSKND